MMKFMGKIIGLLIAALACVYLIRTCLQLDFQATQLSFLQLCNWCLAAFIMIYGLFFYFLAWGWFLILRCLSDQASKASFYDVIGIYFRTNILKYLPGNFMEFVGRNYLAHRYGMSHGDIALSSLIETVFLVLSSVLVAAIFSFSSLQGVLMRWFAQTGGLAIMSLVAGVLLSLVLVVVLFRWVNPVLRQRFISTPFLKTAGVVLLLNTIVIIGLGLLMIGILDFIVGVPVSLSQGVYVIGAMALSWTCGFITPGAPGGLGVREAVLFMILSSLIAPAPLMVALALHRLMSILGDGVVFGVGCLMPLKEEESSERVLS